MGNVPEIKSILSYLILLYYYIVGGTPLCFLLYTNSISHLVHLAIVSIVQSGH